MEYREFVEKLLKLDLEFKLAIFNMDYYNIERISIQVGRLVGRYLDGNKIKIDK